MSLYDCLKNAIGLSDTDCACYAQSERPADYNTSKSGLYITDTEYSVPIKIPKKLEDCGSPSVWDMLEKARKEGFNQMLTDLAAAITDSPYQNAYEPFSGLIGDKEVSTYIPSLSARIGALYVPKIWKGVKMKIYSVQVWVDTAGSYDVDIHLASKLAQGNLTPEATVTVAVASGNFGETVLTTPLEIDMSQSNGLDPEEVYVVYDKGAGDPWNVQWNCGCTGATRPWLQYFDGYGVHADTVGDLIDYGQTSSIYTYGIRLNASLSCGMDWLCQDWDFENDPWARVLADLFLLYANRKLVSYILNENKVEPYTIFGREELFNKRDQLNTVIGARLPWLVSKMPPTASHCFTCTDTMRVSSLIV